ncbi:MAG TPA: hypothetical protein VIW78_14520 [Burkholderiales bacterium]
MNERLLRAALFLPLALLAGGCANFAALPAGAPAQEVTARVGAPGTVWKNADGSETWEYPQGPAGVQTFMIDFAPDQTVRQVRQVLGEPYFSRVRAGMSRLDIHKLLGRPREIWYFPARDEEVWIWRYQDVRYMFFDVLFDRTEGTVRTTLRIDELFGGQSGHR